MDFWMDQTEEFDVRWHSCKLHSSQLVGDARSKLSLLSGQDKVRQVKLPWLELGIVQDLGRGKCNIPILEECLEGGLDTQRQAVFNTEGSN